TWHPTLNLFWPSWARQAQARRNEWTVKAAAVQVANGTAAPDLSATLTDLKDRAPELVPAIRKVEDARAQARHDERWRSVKADAMAAGDEPEAPLAAVRGFLKDFPETAHRDEALALIASLKAEA